MLTSVVLQSALDNEVVQLVGIGTGGAGIAALLFWYSWNHRIKTMEKAIESLRAEILAGLDRIHRDMQRATTHRNKLHTEVEVLKARLRDAQDVERAD